MRGNNKTNKMAAPSGSRIGCGDGPQVSRKRPTRCDPSEIIDMLDNSQESQDSGSDIDMQYFQESGMKVIQNRTRPRAR